jgi:hypothetical protein
MSEGENDKDRRALAERQGNLVAALCGGGEPPDGIDPGHLKRAARSLHAKRARGVARTWPVLERCLGERFGLFFEAYAHGNGLPVGGAVEDGPAFARWLARVGMLDDAGRVQLMVHRARRGWPVRVARLGDGDRVAVAARLPWFGMRWFSVPVGRGGGGARTPAPPDQQALKPGSAQGRSG